MKVKSKAEMDKLSNQSSVFMKVEKGETKIRVTSDIHAVKEHEIKVEGKHRAIACPTENARLAIANGESQDNEVPPCPLCELGYPVKTSYLAEVVEREREENGKFYGGEAFILKKGPKLLGEIQNLFDDENWGAGKDYDVKIIATGDKLDRKYSVLGIPAAKSAPLTSREQASLEDLRKKVSLDEMTKPRPYKEINEILGPDFPDYVTAKASEVPF